jgi:hypothetical protein
MTTAMQRLGKHIPEVTLSTIEGHPLPGKRSVQSTTSTRRHTPEDGILHSHRRENIKSYEFL